MSEKSEPLKPSPIIALIEDMRTDLGFAPAAEREAYRALTQLALKWRGRQAARRIDAARRAK